MDRKTTSITTPSGIAIEMKEYLTAGEFLALSDENEKGSLTKGQFAKKILDLAVISVNGSTENISASISDLPLPDYMFLQKQIAALVQGDFSEAKTQTSA